MNRPVFIIAALFLSGIIIGVTVPALGGWLSIAMTAVCLAVVAGALRRRELDPGSRWILLAMVPIGIWQGARDENQWLDAQRALAPIPNGEIVTMHGFLCREPQPGQWGVRLVVHPAVVEWRGESIATELPIEVSVEWENADAVDMREIAQGDVIEAEGIYSIGSDMRNPGGFDRQSWQWQRGVCGQVSVLIDDGLNVIPGDTGMTASFLRTLRGFSLWAQETLISQQGPEASALSRAMLLGDRTALDPSHRHDFLVSGLGHLFAVSGLHTGLVYLILIMALRLLHVPWRVSLLVALLALGPFAVIVGLRVSVLRAVILIAAMVMGRIIGRTVDTLSGLALAAVVLCFIDPRSLWQPGFQLSFLAAFALIVQSPAIMQRLRRHSQAWGVWDWFRAQGRRLLVLTLSLIGLQLALLPIMATHYHLWSWVTVPMNVVFVPFSFLIMVGSAFGLLMQPMLPAVAGVFGSATAGLIHLLQSAVGWVGDHPWAAVTANAWPLWLIGIWYLVLFGFASIGMAKGPDLILKRRAQLAITWLGLIAIVIYLPLTHWGRANLRITFLDVGQGDSTIIELPSGTVLLVDGGRRFPNDKGLSVVEPALRALGIGEVDLVVATHPDADHIGGLVHVVGHFPVDAVAEGDPRGASDTLRDFREAIALSGARTITLTRGMTLTEGDVRIEALNPDPDPARRPSDSNGNSIVLAIHWREADVLIMGDAEMAAERTILSHEPDLECDVLRTGHHGTRNASGVEFLDEIKPTVAVISVGRSNPYGHPHPDHLARLAEAGARTLRTDRDGAVTLETDGWTLRLTIAGGGGV